MKGLEMQREMRIPVDSEFAGGVSTSIPVLG
jgi:hypothetical protein